MNTEELSPTARDALEFLRDPQVKEGIKQVLQEELRLAKEIRDTMPGMQILDIGTIVVKIDDAIKAGLKKWREKREKRQLSEKS